MKTKGINTTEDIDKNLNICDFGTQTYNELRLKSMMLSCYAYDNLSKNNQYIINSGNGLSKNLFNEVYDEQEKFMKENYIVSKNVYTDFEGCVYNSLTPINKL